MNKNILIGITALLMGGIILTGAVSIFAGETNKPHATLINRLVKRFNLKEADVRRVFEEERINRQKERAVQMEERLSQWVQDGKITEAQKKLILEKQKELSVQRVSDGFALKNLTREQRKTKMDEERISLEQWATENGIDMRYLMLGKARYGMRRAMNSR